MKDAANQDATRTDYMTHPSHDYAAIDFLSPHISTPPRKAFLSSNNEQYNTLPKIPPNLNVELPSLVKSSL